MLTCSYLHAMEKCLACGEEVSNANNRINLSSEASKHAVSILLGIQSSGCSDHEPNFAADLGKGYLCRCCFRDIAKVIKLRKDLNVLLENQLKVRAALEREGRSVVMI